MTPSREQLIFSLFEAAELEHNLMCTYLYAAFSLKDGVSEGLSSKEAEAVARWRSAIFKVAVEEMGHLTAIWNITSSLGGSPMFGRENFPLNPGRLPAGVVVKLAPFAPDVLQHFIHLERPVGSLEPEGPGFEPDVHFRRGIDRPRVTPMPMDYDTVGEFYAQLDRGLRNFVERWGDAVAFCGNPLLQLSQDEVSLPGAQPVICLKTASAAFTAIVEQGEGAPSHSENSHFQRFMSVRDELARLTAENPNFKPAFPAARNPLLRRPVHPEGRVWIEHEEAAETVDVANSAYGLMLRLLAYAFVIPRPRPEKSASVDLALGLMRAVTYLAERAARLPAGPSHPECNAGMSFSSLRDAAALPPGPAAHRYFVERFSEIASAAEKLAKSGDNRAEAAARQLASLAKRATRDFPTDPVARAAPVSSAQAFPAAPAPQKSPDRKVAMNGGIPTPKTVNDVDYIEGDDLTLIYEGKKCIHARFCVTGAPKVFIANVKGPWIDPNGIGVDRLVEISHACPSGAIKYQRKDGKAEETAPSVNLIAVREAGPYAVRADIRLDGEPVGFRATFCRCGASKNKPYCDGSHHDVAFAASGEPATGKADMLETRDGGLRIDPQVDGPLQVRGNLEITSGTGRVVARVTQARLCRCGGSNTKPFCDGTHAKIGFKSA
jgi:CDGSH-type Zn-finger protein/uncharacterized Fe-S cluster protein YjdI